MMLKFHDLQAQYVPEVAFGRFQFFRPPDGLPRFRESLNGVALLLDQNVVAGGLIDLHGLPAMGLDEQFWLATDWLPRVSAGPLLRHVAFVMPPNSTYNQMAIEALHWAGRDYIRYEVQFFGETASALDWLLGFQDPTAQAGIEREWAAQFIALAAAG